ncbi:AAA family ATPase [Methylobacterium nigriterrae]|uniref:AAA family ATPase n=1 Tax=Methylobacterium nigriterrae TaxID=3127512 RepID=UPI003013BA93
MRAPRINLDAFARHLLPDKPDRADDGRPLNGARGPGLHTVEPGQFPERRRDAERAANEASAPGLGQMSAADLMRKELPPVRTIVPGFIPEGLTLLAGKGKIGKSWLLMTTAIAVATGGVALNHILVDQGDVLCLCLEDNERRLQKRLAQLLPGGKVPDRLFIDTKAPGLDAGLIEALRQWIDRVPNPRLIVVDVLNRVRPAQGRNESVYDYDVRSLKGLHSLAAEHRIGILVCHHSRKAEAEDPFDCLSGSTGLTGTADTTLVLARTSQGTTLYGRGRDIEEVESAVSFDPATGTWTLLGDATEVRRSDERSKIIQTLHGSERPLSPQEIADLTGADYAATRKTLTRMVQAGEIHKIGRGQYVATPRTPRL